MRDAEIRELPALIGEQVRVSGWLYNARSSGKVRFLVVRDGSGYLQSVVFKPGVPETLWAEAERVTQESSLRVVGKVKEEPRAPGGVELQVEALEIVQLCPEYPITPKEHGTDFLMDNRHLWLRSKRQHAIMRVRHEPSSRRSATSSTERELHPGRRADLHAERVRGDVHALRDRLPRRAAYLTQSGQLYMEAGGRRVRQGLLLRADVPRREVEDAAAPGRVLDGRARGRLHATSTATWTSPRSSSSSIVARVLETRRKEDSKRLERDIAMLERVTKRRSRASRTPTRSRILKENGLPDVKFGDDFGGDEETALSDEFDRPVIVHRYPVGDQGVLHEAGPEATPKLRARRRHARAPRGTARSSAAASAIGLVELLERRIAEHKLPREAFEWYLDVRRYGRFPHAGFGMGIERVVAWLCGLRTLAGGDPVPADDQPALPLNARPIADRLRRCTRRVGCSRSLRLRSAPPASCALHPAHSRSRRCRGQRPATFCRFARLAIGPTAAARLHAFHLGPATSVSWFTDNGPRTTVFPAALARGRCTHRRGRAAQRDGDRTPVALAGQR